MGFQGPGATAPGLFHGSNSPHARYDCIVKCDKCENEATIHEVMIRGGKRVERHLCEGCAREGGVASGVVHTSLPQLLTQYITSQIQSTVQIPGAGGTGGPGGAATQTAACPSCGLTFAQFRQCGLLGCPDCYTAFEGQLGTLLARAHEGGTHHVGKLPLRLREGGAGEAHAPAHTPAAPPVAQHAERVAALRKQLNAAVEAEQYERAAKLRDELARLEAQPKAPVRVKATRKSPPKSTEGES